jgi:uncharacterized protein YbjT (DUF2867 family)
MDGYTNKLKQINMIFITGATGSIGSELCRLLSQAKIPGRAMCRREEQLEQFKQMGLEAVTGDLDDAALPAM